MDTENLIFFLKDITDKIQKNELQPNQISIINDFYITYKFQEQAIKDKEEDEDEVKPYNKTDIISFITLILYIYYFCLNKNGEITAVD